MAVFEVQGPDGDTYEIDAPDEGAALKAFQSFKPQPNQSQQPAPQGFQPFAQYSGDSDIPSLPSVPLDRESRVRSEFDSMSTWKKPLVALDDMASLTANGVSLGAIPWAAAHLRSKINGTTYDQERAPIKRKLDDARARAGLAGMVAEVGGSVLPMAKATQLGATLVNLPKIGKYAGLAADGAVAGAGSAYFNDQGITQGAAFGAAGGAAGQIIGSGVSKLAGKIASIKHSPSERAASEIASVIGSMKGNPQALKSEIDALGPDAMLIDALGERGGALGRRAANINPDARELLESSLQSRGAIQNVRMSGDIARLTGLNAANTPTVEALKKQADELSRPAITAAYDKAAAAGFDLDLKDFSHILNTPMGASAKGRGLSAVRNRSFDAPIPENDALLPKGQAVPVNLPRGNFSEARRAVDAVFPRTENRPSKPLELIDYVIKKGGVQDVGGDLRAADFQKTRKGKLAMRVKTGMHPDKMRESAAQDGYFDDLYGEGATGQSTINDFLEKLTRSHNGERVIAQKDAAEAFEWDNFKEYQTTRAKMRAISKQAATVMGQDASPKQLQDVLLRVDRGDSIDDAIEAARYADALENGVAPQDVPAGMNGEKLKNFSNLNLLDNTKRSLDDVASSSYRSGLNDKGSQASALAKALRDLVDSKVPEYAGARQLRQAAYRKSDAFDLGQSLGRGRIDLDTPGKVGKTAPDDLDAVKSAFGSELIERLLNKNSTASALNMLETPMFKDGAKAVLETKADDLASSLSRERTFNKSLRSVSGNSTTARQLVEMAGGGLIGGAGALATGQDLMTGGLAGLGIGLTRRGGRVLLDKLASGRSKAVAPELAKLLTQKTIPRGPEMSKVQKAIEANKALIARLIMGGAIGVSQ